MPPRGGPPRIARRPRPAPGRQRWPALFVLAAILVVAGAATWVLLGSSLFAIRSVQVIGTGQVPAAQVRAIAAVPLDTPMLRLDTDRIRADVAALPQVMAVQVSRSLGGTVRIAVTERTPIAIRPAPDGIHLVDATGADYTTVPTAPVGLPELRVTRPEPGDAVTMAALAVLTGLPPELRVQVLAVGADSPADVVLQLTEEREVRWGGVEAGERKAAVLVPLLTQPGAVYDVSSPELPTIS